MAILRMKQVCQKTGLSRTSVWRRIKDHDFPAPMRLGGAKTRAIGWEESSVDHWIASLAEAIESQEVEQN